MIDSYPSVSGRKGKIMVAFVAKMIDAYTYVRAMLSIAQSQQGYESIILKKKATNLCFSL